MRGTKIILVIAGLIIFFGCQKSNQFTISGKITHAEGKTIYLEELLVSSATSPIDSAKINKKGEFKFKGETNVPTYYLLKFSNDKFITLLVDSMEQVTVSADFANLLRAYSVEGSPGSKLVKDLNDKLNSTRQKLDSLQSLEKIYRGNPDYNGLIKQWQMSYDSVIQAQVDYSTNFVMNNPFSMASILALYQKLDQQNYVVKDLHTMRVAASALNSIYPSSEHVKALYANTVQLMKDEQNAKMQRFIAENGQNSPDIVLPNPEGTEIALSSLQGKVVLVQFWSAVDRGSRIFNPVLVEIYQKYKSKGFEIYQVSVDENRIEWVDAIDKDNLSWFNVGDMKGSIDATNKYNVKSVPYNYLLDREGRIVAQNLKGPGLTRALDGMLK